jgi:hypothetical protein
MHVSRRMKITIMTVGVGGIVSTPVYWLADSPDTGQLVAACVQCATGIIALVWAVFTSTAASEPGFTDAAIDTGKAKATGGGKASTGVRRPRGAGGGSAKAERTGDAAADSSDSNANTGVDYS